MRQYPLNVLHTGNDQYEILCAGLVPRGSTVTAGDPEQLYTELLRLLICGAVAQAHEASIR